MESKPKFRPNPNLKLMDQVREVLHYHHCAYRTEQTYCQWILRYIHYFGGKTHPRLLGAKEIETFLSHLATKGKVTVSTHQKISQGIQANRVAVGLSRPGTVARSTLLQYFRFHTRKKAVVLAPTGVDAVNVGG